MKCLLAAGLLVVSAALFAQAAPTPGIDDPRLQTLVERPGEWARLVVFPDASLTLIMRKGERVQKVVLSDSSAFHVAITGDNDSLYISPLHDGALATMQVVTGSGSHQFNLETGHGLSAAYVVRLVATPPQQLHSQATPRPDLTQMVGHYSMKGDSGLRPAQIADDGAKTYIGWSSEQSLPAVLGIGPSGEEVVPGYMRAGVFTIDRVYPELVFRIDRRELKAIRQRQGVRGEH